MVVATHGAFLVVECVTLRRSRRQVLADVSFGVASGETVAIVGPNGAGKTSLMLAMMGLLPLDRGQVLLENRRLQRLGGRRAVARRIAYVPQQYEGFTGFTVYDMVSAGRYAHQGPFKLHTPGDRRVVDRTLRMCGLDSLRHRVVSQLSGGERQKVWLAAAVAQESPILFLDEPTTALDPRHHHDLVSMLRDLQAEGRTLVLICHDLNLAIALKSRILALKDGRLVFDGPVAEFLSPANLGAVFDTEFACLQTADGEPRVLPFL